MYVKWSECYCTPLHAPCNLCAAEYATLMGKAEAGCYFACNFDSEHADTIQRLKMDLGVKPVVPRGNCTIS